MEKLKMLLCEKKIADLEIEQRNAEKLLEAGDHSPELLKAITHRQNQIEELETKLLSLLDRLGDHWNKS